MKFENIVFFSPSMITGGAEYYFIRLAEYIADYHQEFRVYYTEFTDGFAKKVIRSKNVKYLDYTKGKKTTVPDNSVICFSLNFSPQIDKLISYNRENSNFMIWVMHYRHLSSSYTMDNYYKVGKKCRKEVGTHLEKLSDLGVLKFLGNVGYLKLSQQFLFNYHPIEALPIPVSTEKYGVDTPVNRQLKDVVRFCWLGRLDKEKSRNILTYMNELENLNKNDSVQMSLIGVGPAETMLRKESSKYSFRIDFVGEKREDELDDFIRKNVDVGLASGTSSMEFALRKVPVIQDWLLDRVYKAGERDTYYLYGQTSEISEITPTSYRFKSMGSFKSKFFDLKEHYNDRCEESYTFVMSYSVSCCVDKFLEALSKLETADAKDCYLHIDALNEITLKARNNWMEKLHLRRLFVPICKLFSVTPAVI